ncbi:MAG: DNA repair protein RecO [Candidatus Omnitrophota bacterium]|nr:DNA repair protein RecO [Candidatus Omnitrophota bacterium]
MVTKDFAFVLKRYNFRETSLLVNFYTLKFGKITGILKGFYTSKKEFSSNLDVSSLNEIIFYPKKRDIWLVSFTDLVSDYDYLRKNIAKAKVSSLFLNIIDKTMQPLDRNEHIFDLLKVCLDALGEQDERKMLYIFLIKFLTISGVKPEFNRCIVCHSAIGKEAFFSVVKGGLLCRNCYRGVDDYQKISRETISSLLYIQDNDFPFLLRLKPTCDCEKEILYILQEFLRYHLDFNIPL